MLPKISFLARLTRESETRATAEGMCITKVGLACSEKYGEKETVLFIDGTAFKKTAEMIAQVGKGQRVFVTGKLQTDQWQDAESGQKRSKISMIIESFEFIEPKDQNQQQQNSGAQQQQGGFNQNQPNNNQQQQQGGFQQNQNNSGSNQGQERPQYQQKQQNSNQNKGFQQGGYQEPDEDMPF